MTQEQLKRGSLDLIGVHIPNIDLISINPEQLYPLIVDKEPELLECLKKPEEDMLDREVNPELVQRLSELQRKVDELSDRIDISLLNALDKEHKCRPFSKVYSEPPWDHHHSKCKKYCEENGIIFREVESLADVSPDDLKNRRSAYLYDGVLKDKTLEAKFKLELNHDIYIIKTSIKLSSS